MMTQKDFITVDGKDCIEYTIPRSKFNMSGLGMMGILSTIEPWAEDIDLSNSDQEIVIIFDNRIPMDVIERVLSKLWLV